MWMVTLGAAKSDRLSLAGLCLLLLAGCAQFGGAREPAAASNQRGQDLVAIQRQATEAYAKQDWATSEQHYVALIRQVSADAEPWFKLGNIYARTNRFDLAVRAYREAVVRDAKHSRAWHNMGVIQLRQAGQTFAELRKYAAPDDPLVVRGVELGHAVGKLLAPDGDDAAP